jgi:hypothetical protein
VVSQRELRPRGSGARHTVGQSRLHKAMVHRILEVEGARLQAQREIAMPIVGAERTPDGAERPYR